MSVEFSELPRSKGPMNRGKSPSSRPSSAQPTTSSISIAIYCSKDNHTMHRIAAQVPYDTIVVLINTKRYGGGSICLDYCTSSVDHPTSPLVFLHEFGHSFAYLADEYIGGVAYNDMYPIGVEPVEPNITRELDPNKIKWKCCSAKRGSLCRRSSPDPNARSLIGAFEGGGYLAKGGNASTRSSNAGWVATIPGPHSASLVARIKKMVLFYAPDGK